jgi:hypothetical protein
MHLTLFAIPCQQLLASHLVEDKWKRFPTLLEHFALAEESGEQKRIATLIFFISTYFALRKLAIHERDPSTHKTEPSYVFCGYIRVDNSY